MKKKILAIISVMLLFVTVPSAAQTATFTGKVSKLDKADTLLVYVQGLDRQDEGYDTIKIDKKGRFTMSYDVKQLSEALVFVKSGNNEEPSASFCTLLQPGKTINVTVCVHPFSVVYSGDEAAKSTYANQYYQCASRSSNFDGDTLAAKFDTYAEARAFLTNDVIAPMEKTISTISDKTFVSQAQGALDDSRDNALFAYANSREKMGKPMANDADFMNFVNGINRNDTLQAQAVMNYIEWYYAAHPSLYSPMSASGAKLKYLGEYTSNQDVRNRVANGYLMNIMFLASWGMDTASSDLKDMYEQYLQVCTDTSYVAFVKENLAKISAQAPGQNAIVFALADPQAQQVQFTSLIGNGVVTYFDFWATWCGPCKREIPYLAKLVEEYRASGLLWTKENPTGKVRIISVSIDSNRDAWLKKLEEDNPKWEQFIVPDLQNCPGLTGYNINSIPRFMLFDADGKLFKSAAPRPSDVETRSLIESIIKK